MRIYIPATDVQPGDHLAGLGRVGVVTIHDGDVTITMDWRDALEVTLGTDANVWVERGEVGAA